MHVLHVFKDAFPPVPGGIEKHIDSLTRFMPGVTSTLLACGRSPHTRLRHRNDRLDVLVGEFGRLLSVPLSPAFPAWIRRFDADVVHVHSPNPLGEISALTLPRRTPIVLSHHADIARQAGFMPVYRPIVRSCLDRASAIVVGSHRVRASSPMLRPFQERIQVIPYAVDAERFSRSDVVATKAAATRRCYGSPLVLALGRLVYYKGYDVLIAAAERVDADFVIVGDGPLAGNLRALAAGNSRVHFTGPVDEGDLPALLAAADVFVQPSTSHAESFGIATLEAQALGVPAIVTDLGTGTVDTVENGVTGRVVQPRDSSGLADAITTLLGDEALRVEMGRAARERIVRGFDARQAAGRVRRVYEEALAGALEPDDHPR